MQWVSRFQRLNKRPYSMFVPELNVFEKFFNCIVPRELLY